MHYQFKNLILDTQLYQLIRDGAVVSTEPQVFDLLLYLIENRNRVVARDELLDKLWEGRVVSDSALSARLKAARKAVGDSGSVQNTIKTVHGRGYQFIAEATEFETQQHKPKSDTDSTAPPPLPPSDKPSIAVLPLQNLSNDPEQEYFSDGITEDIITGLSRFRELRVIARHSAFFYKGKAVMVRDIGESLKVGYVVEGSVRKSGDRVRITAQLVDASSEAHIWADRYDRNVDDVFEVQDEVTRAIVGVLAGQVTQSSQRQATRSPTSASAYDYVLRGQAIISESEEANQRAREMYEKAISLDPSCARAHAGVAGALLFDWLSGWGEPQADTLGLAFAKAKEALGFDNSDPKTRSELGKIHMYRREYEQAEIHSRRALTLNPNDSDVMAELAMLFTYSGKPREAIHYLSTAKELNPFHLAWHLWFLGFAQYNAREYEQAVATLSETIESGPQFVTPHRHLAACYAQLDEMDLARHEAKQILELDPNFRVDSLIPKLPFKRDEDRQHYLNALIKVGLPR